LVKNVDNKEKYERSFNDLGGGIVYGFDYSWWYKGASAYCVTIGSSFGAYAGLDYYWCIN